MSQARIQKEARLDKIVDWLDSLVFRNLRILGIEVQNLVFDRMNQQHNYWPSKSHLPFVPLLLVPENQ
jgi:hypothetical protein